MRPDEKVVDIRTTRLDTVTPKAVTWLWGGRLAHGKLTVLEGDPGLGKSTLTIDIAARISRGQPLPGDGPSRPGDVLFLTYEDGIEDTILPRLIAAGADLTRVHALSGVTYNGGSERLFNIPADVPAIQHEVERTGAVLLIIDPIAAALTSATDSYKDTDTRQALAPLARMADETGITVLLVRHLTKGAAARAINAGGGSIAFAAAARAVLAVHPDPHEPTRRVLAVVKSNLAPLASSLSFALEDAGHGCAKVAWQGTSEHSAETLNAARFAMPGEREEEPEAQAWLRAALSDGERERRDILRAARDNGFPPRTIERAGARLRVQKRQEGFGTEKRSYWGLPTAGAVIPATRGGSLGSGGNGEIGGIEAPPPSRPTRTIERDGAPVQQELMPTAHGDRWVDLSGRAA